MSSRVVSSRVVSSRVVSSRVVANRVVSSRIVSSRVVSKRAVRGEVQVLLFVVGAVLGEGLNVRMGAKRCILQ